MKLIFVDPTVAAPPYDDDGETANWLRVPGGGADPTPLLGLYDAAQSFGGTAGYQGEDPEDAVLGLDSFRVEALIRPDFDALAGTRATVLARGSGGPTVPEGWAFDVRLSVNGGGTAADVELAWSDELLTERIHVLGTMSRPATDAWTHLVVEREITSAGTVARAFVDGVRLAADVPSAFQVVATPGAVLGLGCRDNAGTPERFLSGDVERVVLLPYAGADAGARSDYLAAVRKPAAALNTTRGYWFEAESVLSLRDSHYERRRLIPLARPIAATSSNIDRREADGYPDRAYNDRLAAWEAALGLGNRDRLPLATRQLDAVAALALIEGFSVPAVEAFSAAILETTTADVDIVETRNDLLIDLTDTDAETIDGTARDFLRSARVYGNVDCSYNGGTGELDVSVADTARLVDHNYTWPPPLNNIDGAGFVEYAIDSTTKFALRCGQTNSDEEMYAGIYLRAANVVQLVRFEGNTGLEAHRLDGLGTVDTEALGLTLPSSASNRWDVSVQYVSGHMFVRVRAVEDENDETAWVEATTTSDTDLSQPPTYAGIFVGDATGGIEGDPTLHVASFRQQYPDQPAREWRAISTTVTDPVRIDALLERKNRATADAGYSVDAWAEVESADTFVDYTPTTGLLP